MSATTPTAREVAEVTGLGASGSPDPAAMTAAGFRSTFVAGADLRVDDVRVAGGVVTALVPAKSGKSVKVVAFWTERVGMATRVCVWRRP